MTKELTFEESMEKLEEIAKLQMNLKKMIYHWMNL